MAKSVPATPDAYYDALPAERKPAMLALRKAITKAIPKGFEEMVLYGWPGWAVPLSTYPAGYHCKANTPLPFISLSSAKGHIGFYHMGMYADPKLLAWFTSEWKKRTPHKLDMGKCCIRFKKPEQVPVDLLADLCKRMTVKQWIATYEAAFRKGAKK